MAEQSRSTQDEDRPESSAGTGAPPERAAGGEESASGDGAPTERTPSEAGSTETEPARATAVPPKGRERRAPLDVGEVVWKVTGILATVVRIVGFALAAALALFVVLTVVGVNPQNGVARVVGGVADTAVLAFRDLFLLPDPVFAVVVNHGLAAVFWVLVAEFGSRLIRFVGARLA